MKNAVRQRALELGFDDCRFTSANPPDHAAEFQAWLAQKKHGEMNYLERNAHKRVDPQEVLPGAKSVIVLATSYHLDDRQMTNGKGTSQSSGPDSLGHSPFVIPPIARYARFKDYHEIIGSRLKQLTEFLDGLAGEYSAEPVKEPANCGQSDVPSPSPPRSGGEGPGEMALRAQWESSRPRSLWYVDTGPLLERDLAQRAGLGFVGKHTNLISRQLGNWIFIAEIITTLELEPDAPEKNRCGSCSRCISACPTAAITAPFQLDARRCISYLTIELKSAIPLELRSAIGNRIYGCDDCLAACPWNKFAREGNLMKEHARTDLRTPDLLELLSLDNAGFKSRFAGTPILRTKRKGLLRNVCVALGNIGDETALPALKKAAEDLEPLIAEHARWAIEQIQARSKN
jgi:epoxyqueuosine reductase